MPKIVDIRIGKDNSKEVIDAVNQKIPAILGAVGAEAVTYAQGECPVDTGVLRNSIAWATTRETAGHLMAGEGVPSVPKGRPDEKSVYIGTNTEYGVYVEYGNKPHKTGKSHFLRDSVANHQDHYEEIIKSGFDSIK